MKKDLTKYLTAFNIIVFSILLGIIIFKANHLYFWYDESYSFTQYSIKDMGVFLFEEGTCCPANNHLTNTIWMKLMAFFDLKQPFFLRVHSIIGFIVYAASLLLLTKDFSKKIKSKLYKSLIWLLPILVTLFPPVIHQFYQARGYGLAIATVVLGIYLFSLNRFRYKLLATIVIGIAAASNLAMINLYFALLGLFGAFILLKRNLKQLAVLVGVNITFVIYLSYRAILISRPGVPRFSTDQGFFLGTLGSILELDYINTLTTEVTLLLIILFSTILFVAILGTDIRNKWQKNIPLYSLILSIIGFYLQAYLLGGSFISGRTASFLLPLLFAVIVTANLRFHPTVFQILKQKYIKVILASLFAILLSLVVYNYSIFESRVRLSQSDINDISQFIDKEHQEGSKIGVDSVMLPSLRYNDLSIYSKVDRINRPEDIEDYNYNQFDYIISFGRIIPLLDDDSHGLKEYYLIKGGKITITASDTN